MDLKNYEKVKKMWEKGDKVELEALKRQKDGWIEYDTMSRGCDICILIFTDHDKNPD
jgi:hypothetical protein